MRTFFDVLIPRIFQRTLMALAITMGPLTMLAAQGTDNRPSIIMVYTDDMGYGDISSFSSALTVKTPNIDRLATEGRKLTNFYVASPICSPSRAAVLSGMYAPRSRIMNYLQAREGNYNSAGNDYMDPNLAYLPRTFQNAGYATAHIGKWHLGGGRDVDNAPSIAEYGYDEFYSTWESPNPDPKLGVKFSAWDRNTEPNQVPRHQRTEYMVNQTLDFMNRHPGKPCFITLWADDLHTPFRPSPAMIAKYDGNTTDDDLQANFHGVLEEYDRQIGRLLDGLTTLGRAENSIVFFTGDNGPSPKYANNLRTDGMIGRKLSLHEGGIRQPFLIRWPGRIPAGSTDNDTIMSTIDLLPTLTAMAGVTLPAEAADAMDGEDLSSSLLTGTPLARQVPLKWEYGRTSTVPRPGPNQADWSPPLAMRDGDFKLLVNYNGNGAELYNVRTDRNEQTNIASSNVSRVNAMRTSLLAWSQTLPARDQPYPVFATVDYSLFSVSEIASVEALQAAAGAANTAAIDGVTCDPYGHGDVFVMHRDLAGKETLLKINDGLGPITKITDSDQLGTQLGTPNLDLQMLGGFEYSAGGNRIFLAATGFSQTPGQVGILSVEVSTGFARIITQSTSINGLSDLTVMPDSTLIVARGDANGNNSVGTVTAPTGVWTQTISEAYLINRAPGQTSLTPKALAANNSTGEIFLASEGANPLSNELFRITNPGQINPSVTRQTHSGLAGTHFADVATDQAGNMYGLNDAINSIAVLRNNGTLYFTSEAQIQSRLGSINPVIPTKARGLAARMRTNLQADLYLASSTPNHGLIRIRYGTTPAAVDEWSLY